MLAAYTRATPSILLDIMWLGPFQNNIEFYVYTIQNIFFRFI